MSRRKAQRASDRSRPVSRATEPPRPARTQAPPDRALARRVGEQNVRRAAAKDEGAVQRAPAPLEAPKPVQRAALPPKEDGEVQRAPAPLEAPKPVQRAAAGPTPGSPEAGRADDVLRAAAPPGERTAHRASNGGAPTVGSDLERKLDERQGQGEPLDPGVRRAMEDRLGSDLSGVRVHADQEAGSMARKLDAQAFTTGQDVYFGEGKHDPGSREGQQLLAHELVHTVQQKRGGAQRLARRTTVSQPGDPAEREAESIAQRVTAGPERPKAPAAGVQRQPAASTPSPPAPRTAPDANPATKETTGADASAGFRLQLPGGAISIDPAGAVDGKIDLAQYADRIPGLRLSTLALKIRKGKIAGGKVAAGVSVPFVTGEVTLEVDESGTLTTGGGKLEVEVPHFARGKLTVDYAAGALSGSLTVGKDQITVPALPIKDTSLTIRIVNGDLAVDGHATTGKGIPGLSEGRLAVAYDGQKKTFAVSVGAQVEVPGLDAAAFSLAMDGEGNWKGTGDVSASFSGASGSVHVEHENFGIKKAEGTVGYTRGPLAGSLTVRLTPPEKGAPGELAISGEGDLAVQVAPFLKGSGHAVLYPDGNVDLSGALTFPSEVELFKERKFEKTLFQLDQEFPLWGVTIPVVGSIGLIAEIHAKLGVRSRFGPGVLRGIVVEGTYSTREGAKAPEAGGPAAAGTGDPAAAPEPSFAVSGEFFLPAGAELVVIVGGGVGLAALIAELTGGIDLVGTAGAYSTVSVRPRFQYKDGKYSFRGTAELQAALVATLGVDAYAAAEVGIGWLSKEVWRKNWNLASFTWDPGISLGLQATMDYTLGEPFEPKLDVQPMEIDPKKLVKSAMPDSGQPTPDKPKDPAPKATLKLDPDPEAEAVAAPAPKPEGAGQVPQAKAPGKEQKPGPAGAPASPAGPAATGKGETAVPGAADPAPPDFVPPRPAAADKVPETETEGEMWEVFAWDRFLDDVEKRTGRHLARQVTPGAATGAPATGSSTSEKKKQKEAENLDLAKAWEKFHDKGQNPDRALFDQQVKTHYWDFHGNQWKPRRFTLRGSYHVPRWPVYIPPQKGGVSAPPVRPGEKPSEAKTTPAAVLAQYQALAAGGSLRGFPRHPREDVRKTWQDAHRQGQAKTAADDPALPAPHDVDHIVELQLGGTNDLTNLQLLHFSDNRSAGPTINAQLNADARRFGASEIQYDRAVGTKTERLDAIKTALETPTPEDAGAA
ncbi:MAG TPA: DUF4157 domain-containing protein [Longimicrobium sp.]|nr:DUF4157 domain-containing protein [Longimicrobium sp.]